MLETLLGGVFGGVLRLAPEVFKLFNSKGERAHELAMLQAEMEFAKVRGEIAMRQTEAVMTVAELNTMAEAMKEQNKTASAAGAFVSGISALVRPMVTYMFLGLYVAVKVAAYLVAVSQGGEWKDVIISLWAADDMAVLNMIISFWFVGRVYERTNK